MVAILADVCPWHVTIRPNIFGYIRWEPDVGITFAPHLDAMSFVASTLHDGVIGALVWLKHQHEDKNGATWGSCGTVVVPKWRRCGVANHLWATAMEYINPQRLYVTTITKHGQVLATSLARRYQDVDWRITDRSDIYE